MALAPLATPKLAPYYTYLRNLRPVIFYELAELKDKPEIWALPPSLVVQQLFTRGPKVPDCPLTPNRN